MLLSLVLAAAATAQTSGLIGFATYADLGLPGVTGGAGGPLVRVRTAEALRQAVAGSEPRVIILDADLTGGGVEDRDDVVTLGSNKTLIGAGAGKALGGFCLEAEGQQNIIVRNITLSHGRPDGIGLRRCHHVWIDHCDLSASYDGLLDFTLGSDYMSVTHTKLHDHNKVSITNSGTCHYEDYGREHVTFAHCWFADNTQRNPRIGYGRMHIYNCYWTNISSYCIGFHSQAQVLSENNHFSASASKPFCNQYTDLLPYTGFLTDRGSYFANGTPSPTVNHPYGDISYTPTDYYSYDFDLLPTADVVTATPKGVGPQDGLEYEPILCPGNGAIDVPLSQDLTWSVGCQPTSATLRLGTSPSAMAETTAEAVTLAPATTYYWQVTATVNGRQYPSPVYRFTTAAAKPAKPAPADGEQRPWLRWPSTKDNFCTDMPLAWRPAADAILYKVYLDSELIGETRGLSLVAPRLTLGREYTWRVDAVTAAGQTITGDTWRFASPLAEWLPGKNQVETMYLSGIAFTEKANARTTYTVGDQGPGAVVGLWGGESGTYAIETAAIAQTLGSNRIGITVNGTRLDDWLTSAETNGTEIRKTRHTVSLTKGDEVRVEFVAGYVDGGLNESRARIDYVTFTPTDAAVVAVARPAGQSHTPRLTRGKGCEYLTPRDFLFTDTLGTVGERGAVQVRDSYCSWITQEADAYKLYLTKTPMVRLTYGQTATETRYDAAPRTLNVPKQTADGPLQTIQLYLTLPSDTTYFTPVAEADGSQIVISADCLYTDSEGKVGEKGKTQIAAGYDRWMKYTNPTGNEVQSKADVPAFIDPYTDAAHKGAVSGKNGSTVGYCLSPGYGKIMKLYLTGTSRLRVYYTGSAGTAQGAFLVVRDETAAATPTAAETLALPADTVQGGEAKGKNVASATVETPLLPAHRYCVELHGAGGDMLVYALRLWPADPTAISPVAMHGNGREPRYNAAGQRVSPSRCGLIITKGRKQLRR